MTVGDDDGQRARHRPRRLSLHAGRLGLRARLQLPRPAHGRRRRGRSPSSAAARLGDVLVAEATQRTAYGRSGLTDVTVTRESDASRHRGVPRPVPVAGQQGEVDEAPPIIEPRPDLYDEAERWSVDELRARQLERLQWSLRHALRQRRRTTARRSTTAGVHPDDLRSLDDLRRFPFTTKADLRAQLPVRHVRRAARAGRRASTPRQRHDRQADRRRLHRATTSTTWADADGALDPRRRRPARRHRARGLRLRPVHRRARRALRRRAARLHGRAGLRRHDRAAGAADRRLRAAA